MKAAKEIVGRFHCKLTARETGILKLVAGGLSSKEIAQYLEIAPSTVESHLESAKSKLGARSRPNLIARAIGCGLVDPVVEIDSGMADRELVISLSSTPSLSDAELSDPAPLPALGAAR